MPIEPPDFPGARSGRPAQRGQSAGTINQKTPDDNPFSPGSDAPHPERSRREGHEPVVIVDKDQMRRPSGLPSGVPRRRDAAVLFMTQHAQAPVGGIALRRPVRGVIDHDHLVESALRQNAAERVPQSLRTIVCRQDGSDHGRVRHHVARRFCNFTQDALTSRSGNIAARANFLAAQSLRPMTGTPLIIGISMPCIRRIA